MNFKENYKWNGWDNCIYLSNNDVDIIATTDVGPRIMRFGFVGQRNNFLEIESDLGKVKGLDFRLYGGTRLWHSPEAKPRSYFPDNEKVNYFWDGQTLNLLQNIESTTGLQKEMIIKLDKSKPFLEIKYRIHNKNLWSINFAAWAITLMAKNGKAVIPQEPYQSWEENVLPVRPLVLWSYTKMNDKRCLWGEKYIQLKQDPNAISPIKIGLLNTLGWQAYYNEGDVFIKRYPYVKGEIYPDFNCNTEVYTDPNCIELETLSPLKTVNPGNFIEHIEHWYLFKEDLSSDSEEIIDEKLLPIIQKTATI